MAGRAIFPPPQNSVLRPNREGCVVPRGCNARRECDARECDARRGRRVRCAAAILGRRVEGGAATVGRYPKDGLGIRPVDGV